MSIQISDFDNALAARDKLIDEQRRKIDDYNYRYYNALDKADKANHNLDSMNEKFKKLEGSTRFRYVDTKIILQPFTRSKPFESLKLDLAFPWNNTQAQCIDSS